MSIPVHSADFAALSFRVEICRIRRVLSTSRSRRRRTCFPIGIADATGVRRVADPGTVVLQTAIDPIRVRVINAYVIELRNRQVDLV